MIRLDLKIGMASLLFALLLPGCATSTLPKFHVLSPVVPYAENKTDGEQKTLVVEQIAIADYLDRPQILRGQQGSRLVFAEDARWAEPLGNGIQRVLSEDLYRLGAGRLGVINHPLGKVLPTHRLSVEVYRFDIDESLMATLGVRWRLIEIAPLEKKGAAPSRSSHVFDQGFTQKLSGLETETIVDGLNQLIAQLAKKIAEDKF